MVTREGSLRKQQAPWGRPWLTGVLQTWVRVSAWPIPDCTIVDK